MTELSHDAGEDAFHEIQLSGKQLVFLFMMTTVVSVLIFLCGVMVGRGVHAESASAAGVMSPGQGETVATAGPGPGAAGPSTLREPQGRPEQSRGATGLGQAERTPPPSAMPPAPPAEGAPQLSYPNTLQSAKPPTEELKAPAADSKKAASAEQPATNAAAAAAETRTSAPTSAPPTPASAPSPAAALATSIPASGASKSGVWAVQVVALTDRAAATAVVQRLSSKGYPAFLVNPQAGAPVQNYKVQVGRYADRAEAEQVKTRLKKEEQFEPWILR